MPMRYSSVANSWKPLGIVLCAIGFSFLADFAVAANPWPVPRGPGQEIVPFQFHKDLIKKLPQEFLDDASACLLYYGATHLVAKDGTTNSIVHEVTRLNGRNAVEKLGEYRGISFDPSYQKLTLNVARVHKPDGKVIDVQPEHVRLRDVATDNLIYNFDKELVISFPSLGVGDVYEVKWSVSGKSPEYGKEYFNRYSFGTPDYPVFLEELRVQVPAAKKLTGQVINGKLDYKSETKNDVEIHTWTARNQPPLPKEVDLPPREELRTQVMCSTFPSWEAIGEWKKNLRADCWKCTPEIQKLVDKITGDLKTPEEKAKALTYWVRRNIRYVSVMSSKHRYTPHLPAEVLQNRYGDCKDQAQLLAVMLKHIGLETYHVSLGMRGDGQIVREVPSPWSTHALLLVKINDRYYWIDTTTTAAAWDFLPRVDRGRVVYLTDAEGNIKLSRTPDMPYEENWFNLITHVEVLPDGSSQCKRSMTYYDHTALVQRERWLDTPPGQVRQDVASDLQDSFRNVKMTRLLLDDQNLHNLDLALQAGVHFTVPKHFTGKDLLEASFTDSPVWSRFLAYNAALDRKQPLDLWGPFESKHHYIIKVPPLYRFTSSNREHRFQSRWGMFRVSAQYNPKFPRYYRISFHMRLENHRVEPKHFEEFREFRQNVYDHWRIWVALSPTKELADAPELEEMFQTRPNDSRLARILAELYLHHGKLDKAQVVLQKILKEHPQDQTLWELAIQATTTLAKEVELRRNRVQAFPNELAYQLDLGKTLVQLGQRKEAEKWLVTVTQKGSSRQKALAHYALAQSAYDANDYPLALQQFHSAQNARADAVQNFHAWRLLGKIHETNKAFAKAHHAYHEAQRLRPNHADNLCALVRVNLAAERPTEALTWLRHYSLAVHKDVSGLVQAAQFHLQMQRWEDAEVLANQARDMDFHADAQKVLGLVALQRHHYDKARFHLERAHRDSEVCPALLRVCLLQGNLTDVPQLFKECQSFSSADYSDRAFFDDVQQILHRHEQLQLQYPSLQESQAIAKLACAEWAFRSGVPVHHIRALVNAALKEESQLAPAYALRGWLELRHGQVRLALADAKKSVALRPDAPEGYFLRGVIGYEILSPIATKDLVTAAFLSGETNVQILYWLARSYAAEDRWSSALQTWEKAANLPCDDIALLQALAQLKEQIDSAATVAVTTNQVK